MKLSELTKGLPVINKNQSMDPNVLGITHDSRDVKKGYLYIALKGQLHDGNSFISEAIRKGCIGVISEVSTSVPDEIALLVIKNLRFHMAQLAQRFYSYPDQSLVLIGITGTNGKTTTTTIIQQILSLSGHPTGLIGTIQNIAGKIKQESIRTTPESTDFFHWLRKSLDEGDLYTSVEVSSIGLEMNRVEGVRFAIGAFTNLTHDHLDFHGDMERYFMSKLRLMNQSIKFITNIDDPYGQRIKEIGSVITLGINSKADYHVSDLIMSPTGTKFNFATPKGFYSLKSPLIGTFNVYNLAFALAIYSELGFDLDSLQPILDNLVGAKGRFEKIIISPSQPFGVLVDYAHTPDALEKICTEGKKLITGKARLHILFGCGGNRDKTKRAEMARIVSKYADVIWHTSDNPRDEDVDTILDDASVGFEFEKLHNPNIYHRIPDRSEAVTKAIEDLVEGDLLIMAGKGHETYQEIHGIKYPYNDKECAERTLRKRL